MATNQNINHFFVFGISHHKAPVEVREAFTLNETSTTQLHKAMKPFVKGGFVLSTCNRTEIYCITSQPVEVVNTWKANSQATTTMFDKYAFSYAGTEAVDYLFKVGNGLDSQILGDFQIIGQLKSAYQKAVDDGLSNGKITRLIDTLLKVSKRVKNETKLSSGVASMAYAGIQYVDNEFGGLEGKKAVVYGAGKMGSAVVRKLSKLMDGNMVFVANRTASRAQQLAEKYAVEFADEADLKTLIQDCDFLISTAAVDQPIFTQAFLGDMALSTKVFVDLSMPRSIARDLEAYNGLRLVNLDVLKDQQSATFKARKASIPAAQAIIDEELATFYNWIAERDMSPTINALKEKLHSFKAIEIQRLQKKNPDLAKEEIEEVSEKLIQKITTQFIKHAKKNNGTAITAMQEIFELDNN
ncbi:MAG: glutamyl-tRNA reductase [Saprospiraceae bacterium]|nr:glutamyl-tRNA reductase [Saprospiraceae bacterium]